MRRRRTLRLSNGHTKLVILEECRLANSICNPEVEGL
jgi:hypothetical protein